MFGNRFTKETQIRVACGAFGTCIGAAAGYFIATRRTARTADEIADVVVEAFSNQLELDFANAAAQMVKDPPSHVRVVEKFVAGQKAMNEVVLGADGRPIDKAPSESLDELDEVEEIEAAARVPEWNQEEEESERTPHAPYIISHDEFHNNPTPHRQTTLEYYAGDDVLCDEKQQPIHRQAVVVGKLVFGHGSQDPNVVYIRNEELDAEYEVIRHEGTYQGEVLGIFAEEEAEQADLKHSQRIAKFRPD